MNFVEVALSLILFLNISVTHGHPEGHNSTTLSKLTTDTWTQPGHNNDGCCQYERVTGSDTDPLVGLYTLYWGPATPMPECSDTCVYKKVGEDDGSLYCFTEENAVHVTECQDSG